MSISPIISLEQTSQRSFTISWTHIPGVSGGYDIGINGGGSMVAAKSTDNRFTAFDLDPFTEYAVTVSGKTSDGGEYSAQSVVRTDPDVPAPTLSWIDSSSGLIEWPKVPDAAGYVTRIFDSSGALYESLRSHQLNKFEFSDLDPYQHYNIEVTARYGEKMLTSQINILTDPEPPLINVKYVGTTYLSVWWPSVPGTDLYEIELSDENGAISTERKSPGNVLNWAGNHLLPDHNYLLRVKAIQPRVRNRWLALFELTNHKTRMCYVIFKLVF